MTIEAYPLAWPAGWKRTNPSWRRDSAYRVDFAKARDDLARNLQLLGAERRTIVVSSNVPTRRDGLPLAGQRQPDDPGVAVYWTVRRGDSVTQRVIACDHWRRVHENLRAVGLSIEALRQLERAGASEILDRAFTGFAALPAAAVEAHWRTVLGFNTLCPITREMVERAFRVLAAERHPDKGGSDAEFIKLVEAKEAALREISQ